MTQTNAGSEKQVNDAEERDRKTIELDARDLSEIMKLAHGRRVINRIISFSGPLREAFNPNGSLTNYNLGRQSVGRWLFLQLDETCPDLFLAMRQEAKR